MRLSFSWPRILWITFVLALPGFIVYSFFPKVFKCPSCYVYEWTGDGLKNYYTLDYYVQHDTGWQFSGMNYPYGENIIYTDNQPLLAMVMRFTDQHIFNMDRHVVGTLNMLLLISIYLGVLFSYVLLRRWEVGRWLALGSALCMTFLSPQLWRLQGHYGLAYVFFIPLLLLLLDLTVREKSKKWLWAGCSGLFIVAMSLTHMYFLLLSTVLIFSYLLFWWYYNRKNRVLLRSVVPWLLGVVMLPGLFLVGLKKWTDHVPDRPIEPWGIDNHTLTFETTFFPFIPPLDKTWTEILKRKKPNNERVAYVGIIGFLLLPAIVFFLFRRKDNDPLNDHLKVFLGTAIITWCMGAGVFYQNGFKFLWEAMPVLKQFRGLGRFGFPFYYLYMMVCTYLIWLAYKKVKEKELGSIGSYVMSSVLLVWGFEAWLNIKAVSEPVFYENKYLASSKTDYVPLLNAAGYKPDDFQAILQFPLVAIGNENMGVTRGFWTMREGIHASTETGLPLIDYTMSRTSVSQGLDIVEMISTPYAPKRRGNLLNEKPILMLCEEEFMIPAERKWIDKATKIGTYQSITLYTLPSSVFKTISLPELPADRKDKKTIGWFVDFEDHPCDSTMTGSGALAITASPQSIWSYTDTSKTERAWIVSFWSRIDNLHGAVPVFRMMETDPTGNITQTAEVGRESILWSEAYGDWIEINFPWTTKGAGYTYQLFINYNGPVIDNLLIRPTTDTCIYHFPEMILYNNLPIPATK